jgi:peptidoglycan hydrolase-like protein with peptidoglycan-binding domain
VIVKVKFSLLHSLWDSGATSTRRVIGGGAPTSNSQTEQKDYLKNGSKGENVKKVQQMLRELGYGIGSAGVDGIFGKDTENAVKKFQKDWGLSVDGIVGNQTLESLKALSNLRNAPDFVDKKKYMEDLIKKIPQGKADFSKIKDVSAFPAPAKTVGGIKVPEAKKANDIKGSDTSQAQNTNGSAIGMDIRYEVKGYDNNLAGQLGAIQRSIRENPADFFSGIAAAATNAASVGLSDEAFSKLRLREPDTLSFMAGRVIGGVAATTKSSAGMVGGLAKIVTGSGAMLGSIVLTKGTAGLGAGVGVIGILQGLAIAGAGAAQVSYNGAVVASAGSALSKDVNTLFIKAANASGGGGGGKTAAKGLTGKDFEDYLNKEIGGSGSFSKGGRDFDGAVGNRWWEAKSGQYWDYLKSSEKNIAKFKSDMGDRLNIAKQHGATYELHSNTPIPQEIKDWLTKKGISFFEHK